MSRIVSSVMVALMCAHATSAQYLAKGYGHYAPQHHGAYAVPKQVIYPAAAYEEPIYAPQPYNFGYKIDDGYGNNQHQEESGDSYGNKKGSYGFTDAYGIYRKVDYIADEGGFRATISTNEPGTADSHPADAKIISAPAAIHTAPAYHAPVYAAPAYTHAAPVYAPRPHGHYAPAHHAAPLYKAGPVYKAAPIYSAPVYAHGA